MTIKMTHPDLPDAEIEVVDPRGVAIHRQSGWQTEDENPKADSKKTTARAAADNKE